MCYILIHVIKGRRPDRTGKGKFSIIKQCLQSLNIFRKMHRAVTITKHYTIHNKKL